MVVSIFRLYQFYLPYNKFQRDQDIWYTSINEALNKVCAQYHYGFGFALRLSKCNCYFAPNYIINHHTIVTHINLLTQIQHIHNNKEYIPLNIYNVCSTDIFTEDNKNQYKEDELLLLINEFIEDLELRMYYMCFYNSINYANVEDNNVYIWYYKYNLIIFSL